MWASCLLCLGCFLIYHLKERGIVVTKKINDDGTITWTYSSLQELSDAKQHSAENPYYVDADLEAKDKHDDRYRD